MKSGEDNVIFPFLFPKEDVYQPHEIYFNTSGYYDEGRRAVCLNKGQACCLNTYFNAFDLDFWAANTEIDQVAVVLRFRGSFIVRFYLSDDPNNALQHLAYEGLVTGEGESARVGNPIRLATNRGFLTVELTARADGCAFLGGAVVTEADPRLRMPRISMAVCTCKREKYVLANLTQWRRDLFENSEWTERFDLHLVDNGGTLEDVSDAHVHLHRNVNSGGSGGFTRGMMEALKGSATHLLLMDDDLTLHSGVMYRGWYLLRYLKPRRCVSAAMIRFDGNMCVQHERGGTLVYNGDNAVALNVPVGCDVDIRHFSSLFVRSASGFAYGAWWWYLCPVDVWKRDGVGYSFPFYVKADDIDFNLRVHELGYDCVFPSGMAVWHEPFYKKFSTMQFYLIMRNNMILAARHGIGFAWPSLLFKDVFNDIMTYHYGLAEMKMAGVEDFLAGPSCILDHDPLWPLRFRVRKFPDDDRPVSVAPQAWPTPCETKWKKRIIYLTLGGLFLPTRRAVPVYDISRRPWTKFDTFRCSGVTYVNRDLGMVHTLTRNRLKTLRLTVRLVRLAVRLKRRRAAATAQWREAYPKMTTAEFWKDYLKLT